MSKALCRLWLPWVLLFGVLLVCSLYAKCGCEWYCSGNVSVDTSTSWLKTVHLKAESLSINLQALHHACVKPLISIIMLIAASSVYTAFLSKSHCRFCSRITNTILLATRRSIGCLQLFGLFTIFQFLCHGTFDQKPMSISENHRDLTRRQS